MKLWKGDYQKYVFWSIVSFVGFKALTEPQGIQLAFSSGNELLAATFGLIVLGIIIGSIIFILSRIFAGIGRIFKKKKVKE